MPTPCTRPRQQSLCARYAQLWGRKARGPLLRTLHVQFVALTLLRLLQSRLHQAWGTENWWLKPAWNPRKRHGSVLDLHRLFWRHRAGFSQLLVALEDMEPIPEALASRHAPVN